MDELLFFTPPRLPPPQGSPLATRLRRSATVTYRRDLQLPPVSCHRDLQLSPRSLVFIFDWRRQSSLVSCTDWRRSSLLSVVRLGIRLDLDLSRLVWLSFCRLGFLYRLGFLCQLGLGFSWLGSSSSVGSVWPS
jgi:hypothetical protein